MLRLKALSSAAVFACFAVFLLQAPDACAQPRGVALEYAGPDTLVLTAGEPVCFELVARDSLGNVITGWDTLRSDVTINIMGTTAERDSSNRTWNDDPEGYSWNSIRFADQPILQLSEYVFALSADKFEDGRAEICLRNTKAEENVHLEITPYVHYLNQKSPVMTFVPDTLANFLVDLTDPFQAQKDVMFSHRPFEVVVTARDRYLNTVFDSVPVYTVLDFPGEFGDQPPGPPQPGWYDIWQHSLLDSDLSVPGGVTHFFAFPTIRREKGIDAGHRITFIHRDKSFIRGVCDAFYVADHAPYPFEQMYPPDETHINLATAADDSTITFRWRNPVPPDPYTNAMIGLFDPVVYSDVLFHRVEFYDRSTSSSGGATAWASPGPFDWIDSSLSITVAELRSHLLTAQPDWKGEATELMWYAVSTDTIYETPASNVLADSSRGFRIYVNSDITAADNPPTAADGIALQQNSPNPFRDVTSIPFTLGMAAHVRLTVHDVMGREVAVLTDADYTRGAHSVVLRGADLPGGLYFCRLVSDEGVVQRKMLLLR